MTAIASPLPYALPPNEYIESHRISHRMPYRAPNTRPFQNRKSPVGIAFKTSTAHLSTNESSDDEDLAPIKLSAEAQAILGEDSSRVERDRENIPPQADWGNDLKHDLRTSSRTRRSWIVNQHSPGVEDGSPAPRLVRVSGTRPSPPRTLARDGSFMYKIHDKATVRPTLPDSSTPAPSLRRIRVSGSRIQTRSPPSLSKSREASENDGALVEDLLLPEHTINDEMGDNLAHVHPSTIVRTRRGDEQGIHSTMRVRRIGTGTLLNGPVRRGMLRRQSEDDVDQIDIGSRSGGNTPEVEHSRRAKESDLEDLPDQIPMSHGSPKHPENFAPRDVETVPERRRESPQGHATTDLAPSPRRDHVLSTSVNRSKPTPGPNASLLSAKSSRSSSSNRKPMFVIPSLPPMESAHDQENEPPPTFKRNKPSASVLDIHEDQRSASPEQRPKLNIVPQVATIPESPSRQPLQARQNNTPRRPAPAPPPKMSLIDAATSAGASSRAKKSVHYVLNGRTYRRLDVIGRGGSSRVFRIMAENYKIFALKRVSLEEADTAAIAGYKGEIDLLKKLESVDRVVRLFDYEINEEKGVLSVMMEMGESDFNKMLNEQLKGENAKLDVTFTRHYWKEMLECVKAVHEHEIVHSDLKPANFLLVKGQLKLIDFGIAGAIQTDETVNVHRENQIGTPNYMSPESLVCHKPADGQPAGAKVVKIGKPSDVWSLGCILYQMTYGQPPFAHITKPFERIMSIPNPKVEIQFPGTGIGRAVVPFGLIKTLRRCLQRDQTLRPTIAELLSDSDPFLNPVAISPDMLGRVISNVVGYCRKREEKLKEEGKLQLEQGLSVLPRDEEMRAWPGSFYEKLKEAGREGTAW